MTEDKPTIESASAPVIDQQAAIDAQAVACRRTEEAARKKMMADMEQRRKEEAEIAAAQDTAIRNIRARCEAELAAFARSQVEATDAQ
jgi:hypothetical protein